MASRTAVQSQERNPITPYVFPILFIAMLVLGWELYVRLFHVPSYRLPAPSNIASEIASSWRSLLTHNARTVFESLLGLSIAITIGIPLGILIFTSNTLRYALNPPIVGIHVTPKEALAPVLVLWLGLGVWSKISMSALISFFPIVISTVAGLESTPEEMVELAKSFRLTTLQELRYILLPNALPSIFAGLKVSITLSLVGAIIGEFIASKEGIGYQIMLGFANMDMVHVFACIFILALTGILLFAAVSLIQRISMPWYTPNSR